MFYTESATEMWGGRGEGRMTERSQIIKEWTEASVDSLLWKPQLHTHTAAGGKLKPRLPMNQDAAAVFRHSPNSFVFNSVVCSGPVEHCGSLILALAETMKDCWNEGAGRVLWESWGFLSLEPSFYSVWIKKNKTILIVVSSFPYFFCFLRI